MIKDISGQRSGKLIAVSFSHMFNKHAYWNCRCDCGRELIMIGCNITSGHSKSCDCAYRHGGHGTRIYRIWTHMINRCENKRCPAYYRYGGRGIKMCSEWRHDFRAFRFWALSNGYADDLTIDRIKNDLGYEPANCQWLTKSENSKKVRSEERVARYV